MDRESSPSVPYPIIPSFKTKYTQFKKKHKYYDLDIKRGLYKYNYRLWVFQEVLYKQLNLKSFN